MKTICSLITLLSWVILGNGQRTQSFLEPNCGSAAYKYSTRILNGETTSILEHPWMAYISTRTECNPSTYYYYSGYSCMTSCGGSLITNRYVLSAAHCSFNQYTTIKLGESNVQQPITNGLEIPAVHKISHPYYDHSPSAPKNDIALYKLERTITYTRYIRPVCLPTSFNPLAETAYLTATGWGITEQGVPSNELKKGTMMQLDRSSCYNADMSQICAGGSSSNTCSGDSGGPITGYYRTEGSYIVVQLGLVSYGAVNCQSSSVFTNVMHYMDWIKGIVQGGEGQNPPAPTQGPRHNNNNNNYYNINHNPTNPPNYYFVNGNTPVYTYPGGQFYVING